MHINVPYSISFFDWKLEDRMKLLNEARISCEISVTNKILTPLLTLSSGQEEVFNFVKDPICAINFWKLDNELGKKVLKLHHDFWMWRFNGERETT